MKEEDSRGQLHSKPWRKKERYTEIKIKAKRQKVGFYGIV